MKKIIVGYILVLLINQTNAQYQDSLIRSAGFFISPSATSFFAPNDTLNYQPRFSLVMGFRIKNEIGKNFFIESGVGITGFGNRFPKTETYRNDSISGTTTYRSEQSNITQINIAAPFMVGYRTKQGKVRFEGAAGIAFNIKLFEFEKNIKNTLHRGDYTDRYLYASFGASFNAIARAGISIPINKRATLDILPTARYAFMYFQPGPGHMDINQSNYTDIHKWIVGIDLGLTWKLDDVTTDFVDNEDIVDENAYTYNFEDNVTNKKVKKTANGYKNYIYLEVLGSGMTYSNNYERTIFKKNALSINARAGFGMFAKFYAIPFGANITLGRSHKKFEAGIYTNFENLLFNDDSENTNDLNMNIVPALAFRYESEGHFFLRLSVLSHIVTKTGEWLPGLGVSLGGCF